MKNLKFIALTHTESKYNADRRFCGISESVLSPKGIAQARNLSQKLKDVKIDVAYISPLKRTKQTLDILINKHHPNIEIVTDPRIIERDYGKLTGMSKDKYYKDHPKIAKIYHRSYTVPPPGGESMRHTDHRVFSFVKDVVHRMKREKINVLVVCHSNSLRPIIRYFEHLTPKEMMALENLRYKIFEYKVKAP